MSISLSHIQASTPRHLIRLSIDSSQVDWIISIMGKHSRSAQKKAKQRNSKKVLSPPDNEDPPETSLEDDREDSVAISLFRLLQI